jgi:proline dehydrogenase
MVKVGKGATNFSLRVGLPIKGLIKSTIFKQFCGGETIDECTGAIDQLWKSRVSTILDYSVEGKTSDEDFEATTNEIIATIAKGKNNPAIPFAVFKVTGISRFGLLELANARQLWNAFIVFARLDMKLMFLYSSMQKKHGSKIPLIGSLTT